MEKKEKITTQIEDTLTAIPQKTDLKASPFFKERALRKMQQEKTKEENIWGFGWFTPRYQMAALFCFIILNSFVLLDGSIGNNYDQNLENFAEVYGITSQGIDANY